MNQFVENPSYWGGPAAKQDSQSFAEFLRTHTFLTNLLMVAMWIGQLFLVISSKGKVLVD
jgi:hypothetical protein